MKKQPKKPVMAWALVNEDGRITGDLVFSTRSHAHDWRGLDLWLRVVRVRIVPVATAKRRKGGK